MIISRLSRIGLRRRTRVLLTAAFLFCLSVLPTSAATSAVSAPAGRYGLTGSGLWMSGSLPVLIGGVVRVALGVVGAVFFAVLIYGGIMWMVAGGETERVKTAQKAITNAVIGIAIVFASYFLVSFLIRLSTSIQTSSSTTTSVTTTTP